MNNNIDALKNALYLAMTSPDEAVGFSYWTIAKDLSQDVTVKEYEAAEEAALAEALSVDE